MNAVQVLMARSSRALSIVRLAMALASALILVPEAKADRREDLYRQAIHILGGNAGVVHKWREAIRFVVIGDAASAPIAKAIMSDAAKIANLRVTFPDAGIETASDYLSVLRMAPPHTLGGYCSDPAAARCFNFVAVVTDPQTMLGVAAAIPLRKHYEEELRAHPDTHCFFAPYWRAGYEIVQALVYVRSDLSPQMKRTCLAEEIYQSLGMFQDYTDSTYFSFNNKVAPKDITRYDRALLKALYDPRVTLGYPVNLVVRYFLEDLGY